MPSALLIQENTATGGVTRITDHLMAGLTQAGWQIGSISLQGGAWASRLRAAWTGARQHQVLLATHNFLPAYATWLLATLMRKPWVMWVHGPVLPVLAMAQASPAKRQLLRWLYQRAPFVVFGSQAAQDSFEQFTWPAGQAGTGIPHGRHQRRTVIHNATALQTDERANQAKHAPLSAKPTATLVDAPVHIGFVGRLSAEKQPLQLLELLDHLPAHFVLHVVGDGPLMGEMRQHGQAHITTGRLLLHGQQTVTAQTYTAWQATVLCSAYEGYPMTALESLACGVPCVSTPIPAMQEMLHAQAPYMLASTNDAAALAQALLTTLHTPVAERQQSMHAITQAHSPAQFVSAWLALLHQAIHGASGMHTPGGPA
jgi:glycosyltransferase involved in cell wall biosynthesis